MQTVDRGPRHLARVVLRALSLTEEEGPDRRLLLFFFEVLYQASFRLTAESQGCRVFWQEADAPRPEENFLALASPVPFNVGSLTGLAQAAPPDVSALLVSPDADGVPTIWGLLGLSDACSPELRGSSFAAKIAGPAHVTVDIGVELHVELKRNALHTRFPDVLRAGPVGERLHTELRNLLPDLMARMPPEIGSAQFLEARELLLQDGIDLFDDYDWAETVEHFWIDALILLLHQIAAARQGGLVLISPHAGSASSGPFSAEYGQLRRLLERRSAVALTRHAVSTKALLDYSRARRQGAPEDPPALPGEDAGEDAVEETPDRSRGRTGEIRKAVAFVAGLARADGAMLLTPQLDVKGFGISLDGALRGAEMPAEVWLAGDDLATESSLSSRPLESFGPRAQALIGGCFADPDAIGFAATQDGELRAMLRQGERVIVWDHVRLRRERR